ncbi:unnamed protein product [Urochloa humidicola]
MGGQKESESSDPKNGSPTKKQCLAQSGGAVDLESILSQTGNTKSSIEKIIQIFKDSVGDDFTRHFRSPGVKELDKYENRNSIVVPKSTDPWMLMVTGYMRRDFEKIKGLIAVPVLDKGALASKIAKSLDDWRMLLQDRAMPKEVSELMGELEDLKQNLTTDTVHIAPISVSNLRCDEEHIQDQMKIGENSYRSVKLAFSSFEDSGSLWDKLTEQMKDKKQQHLSKIKELEVALRLTRSELSKEQEREAAIADSRASYDKMVMEASQAISSFEELLAQGKTCPESIKTNIQGAGSQGSSHLPAKLRLQLKFLESCKVEGAE